MAEPSSGGSAECRADERGVMLWDFWKYECVEVNCFVQQSVSENIRFSQIC